MILPCYSKFIIAETVCVQYTRLSYSLPSNFFLLECACIGSSVLESKRIFMICLLSKFLWTFDSLVTDTAQLNNSSLFLLTTTLWVLHSIFFKWINLHSDASSMSSLCPVRILPSQYLSYSLTVTYCQSARTLDASWFIILQWTENSIFP